MGLSAFAIALPNPSDALEFFRISGIKPSNCDTHDPPAYFFAFFFTAFTADAGWAVAALILSHRAFCAAMMLARPAADIFRFFFFAGFAIGEP